MSYFEVAKNIYNNAPFNNPHKTDIDKYPKDDERYVIHYYEISDNKFFHKWVTEDKYSSEYWSDLIVGFYAPDSSASLIFEIGGHSRIQLPIELEPGEFKFALNNKYTYPSSRTIFHPHFYKNIIGKVFVVTANLSTYASRHLATSKLYIIDDLIFSCGMVGKIKYSPYLTPVLIDCDDDEANKIISNICKEVL